MGVLEDITQMRSQGYGDEDIVRTLQEQGISPQAINDALSQAQIKNAVGDFSGEQGEMLPQDQGYADQGYGQQQGMTQEMGDGTYAPQEGYQEYYPQQGYDQGYGQQQGYGSGPDTGTSVEIAEQVFSEKSQKMQKQIQELTEFKTLADSKLDQLTERTKRVEKMLDTMQTAILEKIGSYGRNLENTKKEMNMMQDSFTKMVPSLASRSKRKTAKKAVKKTIKKDSKKSKRK